MKYCDCHIHLSDYSEPKALLAFAQRNDFTFYSVSTNIESSRRLLDSFPRNSHLRKFVGIHPSEVKDLVEVEHIGELAWLADGIGEVGLDPKYSEVKVGSIQMIALEMQLNFAERANKPVQLHTRNAEEICLNELSSYSLKSVLLHWFQSEELSSYASSRGYYVSFGPAILYSKRIQRIAKSYPIDLILVESDGPVKFLVDKKYDGPYLIPSVIFKLSEILSLQYFELVERIASNSINFISK